MIELLKLFLGTKHQAEQTLHQSQWRRRTAGYHGIHRNDIGYGSATGVGHPEFTSASGTVANGNHPFWIRRCLICSKQRRLHVPGDRASNKQHVGMPGRGDKMDAETFYIIKRIIQRMNFQFAAITGTCIYLPYRQAAGKFLVYPPFDFNSQTFQFIVLGRLDPFSDHACRQNYFKKSQHGYFL